MLRRALEAAAAAATIVALSACGSTGAGTKATSSSKPQTTSRRGPATIDLTTTLGENQFADGLAVDTDGSLYVAVRGTSGPSVAVVDSGGTVSRVWSAKAGTLPADYSGSGGAPTAIAVGPDGLIYVRNHNETFIRVYRPTGQLVRAFGHEQLSPNNFGDLEVDSSGNVYATTVACCGDSSAAHVVRFDSLGKVTMRFVPVPGEMGEVLSGLAVADDGSVYVTTPTGRDTPRLVHVSADGDVLDDAPNLDELLPDLSPIDVDFADGTLYVAGRAGSHGTAAAGVTEDGDVTGKAAGDASEVAVHGDRIYVVGKLEQPRHERFVDVRVPD